MDLSGLQFGQIVTTGGSLVALAWVIINLVGDKGSLAPRWSQEQERQARIDAERRADRTLDVAEAAMAAAEKAPRGTP